MGSGLARLLSRLSETCYPADQQFCDALEEALRRADQVDQVQEVNQDLRSRLARLEAVLGFPDADSVIQSDGRGFSGV
jgi:hypothetical protein